MLPPKNCFKLIVYPVFVLISVPKKASNLKLPHLRSLLAFVTDESHRASSEYCRCYSTSYSPSNSLDWFEADHIFYVHTQWKFYIQNVIFLPRSLVSRASKNYCRSPSTLQKLTRSLQIHAARRRCTLPPERKAAIINRCVCC
jgi:hypothetical protein